MVAGWFGLWAAWIIMGLVGLGAIGLSAIVILCVYKWTEHRNLKKKIREEDIIAAYCCTHWEDKTHDCGCDCDEDYDDD